MGVTWHPPERPPAKDGSYLVTLAQPVVWKRDRSRFKIWYRAPIGEERVTDVCYRRNGEWYTDSPERIIAWANVKLPEPWRG